VKGLAYVFLRKDGAAVVGFFAGHVGWGFQVGEDRFFCGSTENTSGAPFVAPGGDNGWWGQEASKEEMFDLFRQLNYDAYKVGTVRNSKPEAAKSAAIASKGWGYKGLGNNCLDHVWRILDAYGDVGLPLAQTHPAPNDWFAVYNGEHYNL
jgi:hypothetical protein